MAKKEETSNGSFNKAMKSLGALEVSFAQFRVGMASKARLKVYKKLASLLRNRFSLMNALDIMYDSITDNGKHPGEPMAIAIASWGKSLQNGYAFSDALKGWAPSRERLMLSVGDMSDLESALLNLIKVAEGTEKMLKPIIGAIAYPSFLLLMSVLVIYAIGAYMVPPMMDAAPNARWTGTAKDLVAVSLWIQKNWALAFAFFPALFTLIYTTIGIWTGPTRKAIDDCMESPEKYHANMPWYQEQISNCTYRQFTTGFFYGKPDENTQIYDSNTYVREYTYLGFAEEIDERGLARLTQRNKFSVGETIEIMKPDGRNIPVTVEAIYNEEGEAMESAPHAQQRIYVKLTEMPEVFDILRRGE